MLPVTSQQRRALRCSARSRTVQTLKRSTRGWDFCFGQLLETLKMWPRGHRMSDEEEGARGKDRPPPLVPSFDVITGV